MTVSKSKAVSEVKTDGRSLKVLRMDSGALFRIGYDGGGVVPEQLSGLYTTPRVAEQDIQKYLAERG